jgi:hypothetical protein
MTHVTRGGQGMRGELVKWMREKIALKYVEECSPKMPATMTKVMVNGTGRGDLDPFDCVKKIKLFRRNALLPIFMSVTFEIKQNTVDIYTDAGRLSRPIFYRDEDLNTMSFEVKEAQKYLEGKDADIHWEALPPGSIRNARGRGSTPMLRASTNCLNCTRGSPRKPTLIKSSDS